MFLFYRALQVRTDGRLEETLGTLSGTCGFWTISALWGVVCLLPHSLAPDSVAAKRAAVPGRLALMGLALALTGIAVEATADAQKWHFKQDPGNKGMFCNVGLWQYSQHPNYFGNLTFWTGILGLNSAALARSPARLALAAAGPLFMLALFYGQASGAMTNTQQLISSKYGAVEGYAGYARDVPLVVPHAPLDAFIRQWFRSG